MLWVLGVIVPRVCVALQLDRGHSPPFKNVFQHAALQGNNNLSKVFQGADHDGDGYLNHSEIKRFLHRRDQNSTIGRSQKLATYPVPAANQYTEQPVNPISADFKTARMLTAEGVTSFPNSTEVSKMERDVKEEREPAAEKKTVSVPMGPIAHGLEPTKERNSITAPEEPTETPIEDTSPPPCSCEKESPAWRRPTRTTPSCFFFDFGASDGESFRAFLGQSSRWQFKFDTATFRPQDCFVYLLDPNPKYQEALRGVTALLPAGQVMYQPGSAAYMCEKSNATFYLDVASPQGWGSSLDPEHESVKHTAAQSNVHVSLVNIMRLLQENTIQSDTVVVKLDIEGAEWDLLPCLANSPVASLIDTLYLESHCEQNHKTKIKWCPSNGMAENSEEVFRASLASLREKGVHVPEYWSPLLF